MPDLIYIQALVGLLRTRLDHLRSDQRGNVTTEMVIITAVLASLAIATTAIIVSRSRPRRTRSRCSERPARAAVGFPRAAVPGRGNRFGLDRSRSRRSCAHAPHPHGRAVRPLVPRLECRPLRRP
jgi:hypothetical protein